MPAILSILALGLASLATASCSLSSCPPDIPVSCQNTTAVENACCFNSPGGLLLLTQFWTTDPPTGPSDSWTIHGLCPDNCDGTYDQYCDPSREYSNITEILKAQHRADLVPYMHRYWPDIDGDDEGFWAHEWNKHGTCINTIEPRCYRDYDPREEVDDYFWKTVDLFKGLDTYKALSNAGITPDESSTYSRSEIQDALSGMHGEDVMLLCSDGAFEQVYYYFHVKGDAIDGKYIPTPPLGETECPESGIKYLPKQIQV